MTANVILLQGGQALLNGSFQQADILMQDGRVRAIYRDNEASSSEGGTPAQVVECRGRYVLPGLVDVQVNGAGGYMFSLDISQEQYNVAARALAMLGTTAVCPTIITGPPKDMLRAVSLAAQMCESGTDGADFVGIHIEGPFLSERKRGGHAKEYLRPPSRDFTRELLDTGRGWVKIFTLAPELPGALDVVDLLVSEGVHVSAGHTSANAAQVKLATDHGLSGATHLFNGMDGLTSRGPGVVGVALTSDMHVGLICDFLHLSPETIQTVLQAKERSRVYVTTDAVSPLGATADEFSLYGVTVRVRDGGCYTDDGTLAGTATPQSAMVKNLVLGLGTSLSTAVDMAANVPACLVGAKEHGKIEVGSWANLLVMSASLETEMVFVHGLQAYAR